MVRVRSPELPQQFFWLNTEHPLSLQALKGRVVILDFWTYCCVNCLHVLPDLKYLEQKYNDCLTVIGVHSAKFDNEKEIDNIRQAILRYDIEHPVLVDRDFSVWQQYAVRAWPTLVVIDPEGYVVGSTSGEGHRDTLEQLIQHMIQEHREKGSISFEKLSLTLEKERSPLMTPLAFPGKILADAAGDRLFIADSGHHRLVITSLSGTVKNIIGTGTAGLKDGDFLDAQFSGPQGMVLDAERNWLYIADTENHTIRRVDLNGQTVKTIAGTGVQSRTIRPHNGAGLDTALNSPWDLVKVGTTLYIAMAGSHQIWALDPETEQIGTYVGTGAEACVDGSVDEAAFAQPSGITSDGKELFVADSETSSVRGISLGNSPEVRTICGSGGLFDFGDRDGQGGEVRLQHCLGITYAAPDQLWIADTYNHKIKQVNPRTDICRTRLGNGQPGLRDDQGQLSQFAELSGLSVAGSYLYVADTNNHTIRQIDLQDLTVTTLELAGLCAPNVCVPPTSQVAPSIGVTDGRLERSGYGISLDI